MSRNAFSAIERETNEAEEQRETNRREISDAQGYIAAMDVIDIHRPRREDGEQAAHLERVMTAAGHRCCKWSPVVPKLLPFEVSETKNDPIGKRIINAIRRAGLSFAIRSLEMQLQSQNTVMRETTDTDLLIEMAAARRETLKELESAQQQYSALLPVGVVKVWGAA